MSQTLTFSKMHGLGNDFMVIDAVSQSVSVNADQIARWADRHQGIGFDQLLLVEKAHTEKALFKYRIFNADGGEVDQCGNGARCFARFVREKGLTDASVIAVETNAGLLTLSMIDDVKVEVNMGIPRFAPAEIPLNSDHQSDSYSIILDGQRLQFSALSLGNPHMVMLVQDVDSAKVDSLGPQLESHELFPERVNVGFMQIVNRNQFKLRVYERGVGETQACGSGACAAMVAGVQLGLLETQATAQLLGGELGLDWQGINQPVMMTGDTAMVYEGVINL